MRTATPLVLAVFVAALVAGLVFPATALRADSKSGKRPDDLAALLAPIREKHGVPALGGAIVEVDGLTAVGVVGVRVAGGDEAVTTDDRWHLGSCTKAMTATLMGRLHDSGRLSLATCLAVALPKASKTMDAGWRDVTLLQLLQHRGGAPHDVPEALWKRLMTEPLAPRDARALLTTSTLGAAPSHEPGKEFVYSNTGYAMVGHAAEVETRTAWEELTRREVFDPLGMADTGIGAPGDARKRDQPWGHLPGDDGPRPVAPGPRADNPPAIGPAGTVHATLGDWAKFVRLHLLGARGVPDLLLSGTTFGQLHIPPDGGDYAAGLVVTTRSWAKGPAEGDTGRVLTHSGSNTMWYATVWIAPERGFAALATCNLGGDVAAKACDDAIGALVARHLADERRRRER